MLQKLQKDDTLLLHYCPAFAAQCMICAAVCFAKQTNCLTKSAAKSGHAIFPPRSQSQCNSKTTAADNEGKDVEG